MRKRFCLAVSAATVLITLAGCSWLGYGQTPPAASPAAGESDPWGPMATLLRNAPGAEISIGAALTLSGGNTILGEAQRKSLQLAVDQINQTVGPGGGKVVLRVRDDGGTPDTAVKAFRDLIDVDQPVAIIGPTLSTTAFAADPLAQEAGIPVLGISNTADGIPQMGDYIFRVSLPESAVIPPTVRAVVEKLHPRRVAILYDSQDAFTQSGERAFRTALEESGVQITTQVPYASGDEDLTLPLLQIRGTDPDVLVAASLPSDAARVLRRARKLDIRVPVIGGNGFNSRIVISSAGTSSDGLIVGTAWNLNSPDPMNARFIRDFRARYDEDPDSFAAQAYASVTILADALVRSGSLIDRAQIRSALATTSTDTILGRFSFRPDREPNQAPIVQIIRHRKLAILK